MMEWGLHSAMAIHLQWMYLAQPVNRLGHLLAPQLEPSYFHSLELARR